MTGARRRRRTRPPRTAAVRIPLRAHWRADGLPKTSFTTQEDANRASLRLRLEEGADLHPYRCELCHDWHLGNSRDG